MKKVTKRKPGRPRKPVPVSPPSISANTYYACGEVQVEREMDESDSYYLKFAGLTNEGTEYFGFNEYQLKRLVLAIQLMLPEQK
jgi:hypothetical protein